MTKFTRKKSISLPILKFETGSTLFVKILEIKTKPDIEKKTGKPKIDPQTGEIKNISVAKVIELESMEEYELVLGAVLVSQLEENYEKEAINGKSFEITKIDKKPGKGYYTFQIYELDSEV